MQSRGIGLKALNPPPKEKRVEYRCPPRGDRRLPQLRLDSFDWGFKKTFFVGHTHAPEEWLEPATLSRVSGAGGPSGNGSCGTCVQRCRVQLQCESLWRSEGCTFPHHLSLSFSTDTHTGAHQWRRNRPQSGANHMKGKMSFPFFVFFPGASVKYGRWALWRSGSLPRLETGS